MGQKKKTRNKTLGKSPASSAKSSVTPASTTPAPHGNRRARWILPALVLATLFAYAPLRSNEFINYDDDYYIVNNPNLRMGLGAEGIRWAFSASYGANWFPLTWLSWMAEYELFGFRPEISHGINLLFHLATTLLLFWVLRRATGTVGKSAVVAALFAVHPMHVESVAWAAERKDVLSAFFWILTMAAYALYVERRSLARYASVLFCFACGLMSKPMLVTLPFVLLLFDVWPLGRFRDTELGRWRLRLNPVLDKVPMLGLAGLSSFITFRVQQAEGAVQSLTTYRVDLRIYNAFQAYVAYVVKAFAPVNLSVYYPHPGETISIPLAFGAAGSLLVISSAAVWMFWKQPRLAYLPVGWFWFVGTLVPVIGLVQVGQQAMADRYTYIPYIGLSLAVVWGAHRILGKIGSLRLWIAIGILFAFSLMTRRRVEVWRNSIDLFRQALAVTENNSLAHINLGVAYLNNNQLENAERELSEAIRIAPGAAEAHASLGMVRRRQFRSDEAIESYQTALRLDPGSANTHREYGNLLLVLEDTEQAKIHLDEAMALSPNSADNHNAVGLVQLDDEAFEEAIESFREAVRLDPTHVQALNNWGVALSSQGRFVEASERFHDALSLRPDYPEALFGLGLAAYNRGEMEDALAALERASRTFGDDTETYYTLGRIYAELNRHQEAKSSFQKTIESNPENAEAHYALGLAEAQLGDLEGSVRSFRAAVDRDAGRADAHYALGTALSRLGQVSNAIASFRSAIALDPDHAETHNAWGTALASSGRLEESLAHFRDALEARPDYAEGHLNWGLALIELDRLAEAIEHFERAVSLDPDNPDAHNNLGVFLGRQGRLVDAEASFHKALALNPGHQDARRNLEQIQALAAGRS